MTKKAGARRRGREASGKVAGVGDDAVRARTGKGWQQWFALLDKAGSADKPHKQIAAWLHERHAVGGWWSQMITVAYEQERGLREVHQKSDGEFAANGSKTVAVPLGKLFAAWSTAASRKRWLADPDFTVRKATRNKSMRITWVDGATHVDANFYAKGAGKSQVTIQHRKLADARAVQAQKSYWSENLERLKAVLEA